MAGGLDCVALYAREKNFAIRSRTILVEGLTDVDLFELAARLEKEQTGNDLLGDKLAIIAAGKGDEGGVKGVGRELVTLKNMAKVCLDHNGHPKYRFIGLFDNDRAGRTAINDVRKIDTSLVEYRDVFKLQPVMPISSNRIPDVLQRNFESQNNIYKNLDWELEDLVPETLIKGFLNQYSTALFGSNNVNGKVHREWTPDGKARLHRFVKDYAIRSDLVAVIGVLQAFWCYLGIK
jgi:hypothetical protein